MKIASLYRRKYYNSNFTKICVCQRNDFGNKLNKVLCRNEIHQQNIQIVLKKNCGEIIQKYFERIKYINKNLQNIKLTATSFCFFSLSPIARLVSLHIHIFYHLKYTYIYLLLNLIVAVQKAYLIRSFKLKLDTSEITILNL